jgi:DNA-binding CsgD family transcriptional regulator
VAAVSQSLPTLTGQLRTAVARSFVADPARLSHQLGITELAVQDHLKSVFARTGAASRADLLARALGT